MTEVTKEEQREIDRIVDAVADNFRAELATIMATKGLPKRGDLTTEQQAAMIADLMGWHRRALDAEDALTTARAEAEGLSGEVKRLREVERLTRIARRDYWFNDCPEYEDRDDLWQDIDDALQAIDKSRAALTETRND